MPKPATQPHLRVLVTNDDGVEAPALAVLASRLSTAGHDVRVAAPSVEYSGCGASIGRVSDSLLIPTRSATLSGAPRVVAVAVDAPPALAVLAGCLGLFGPPPDVVVSGTNSGFNTGPTVLHSGTVGAAMTAAAHGVPAIALSTERNARCGFQTAADFCTRHLSALVAAAGTRSMLNVNVPDLPMNDLAGVRLTRLGEHSLVSVTVTSEIGGLRAHRQRDDGSADDGTSEIEAICRGFVSITRVFGGMRDLAFDSEEAHALVGLLSQLTAVPVPALERVAKQGSVRNA